MKGYRARDGSGRNRAVCDRSRFSGWGTSAEFFRPVVNSVAGPQLPAGDPDIFIARHLHICQQRYI